MIDKDKIIKLAKLNGMRPWQQEKHYIQSLLLNILADKDIVFKGGTYLWFFHGLPRFSEDLDFTLAGKPFSPKDVEEALDLWGVESDMRIVKNNEASLSFRVGVKGSLYTSDKDICYVYVDISKRERIMTNPLSYKLEFPAYNLPIKFIRGLSLEEVAAEKVRAIITRKKSRDVYDLFYLVKNKGVKYDDALVKAKLSYYRRRFSKKDFLEAVKMHESTYKAELKSLLFDELPEFTLVLEALEKWIK